MHGFSHEGVNPVRLNFYVNYIILRKLWPTERKLVWNYTLSGGKIAIPTDTRCSVKGHQCTEYLYIIVQTCIASLSKDSRGNVSQNAAIQKLLHSKRLLGTTEKQIVP